MNDRFKFKVWDVEANQFFEAHTIQVLKLHLRPDGSLGFFSGKTGIENLIICQSTGLKDKNGKLIYEGDIISYSNQWMPRPDFLTIGFCKLRACFTGNGQPLELRFDNGFCESEKTEVIGNIYENPDLLTKENK